MLLLLPPLLLFRYPPGEAVEFMFLGGVVGGLECSPIKSTWALLVFKLYRHSLRECPATWQMLQNKFFGQLLFVCPSLRHSIHHTSLPPLVSFFAFISFIICIMSLRSAWTVFYSSSLSSSLLALLVLLLLLVVLSSLSMAIALS